MRLKKYLWEENSIQNQQTSIIDEETVKKCKISGEKNKTPKIISTSKGRTHIRGSQKAFQISKNAIPMD